MMKFYVKKLLLLPLLVLFFNLGFILLDMEAYSSIQTLVPIILLNTIICLDMVIRPSSSRQDEYNRAVVTILFLLMPALLVTPHLEGKTFAWIQSGSGLTNLIVILGVVLMLVGGTILITARFQLGVYRGPKITVESEHVLVTTGLYGYVRHPMYFGFLLLFFGYAISLGSFIISIAITVGLFIVYRSRMELEERLLSEHFGEEYLKYASRTKRLFPHVY